MSRLVSAIVLSLTVAGLVGANVVWAATPAASATSAAPQRQRPHLVQRAHRASTASAATEANTAHQKPHLVRRSHRSSAAAKSGS